MRTGIHPLEFWDLTLHEIDLKYLAHVEEKKENINFFAIAIRNGIDGALNGSDVRVFKEENNVIGKSDTKTIDLETKKQEFNYFKNLFSENIN